MPTSTNRRNLIPGGPGRREGKIQRGVRRALVVAGSTVITTTEIMEMAYPDGWWPVWRWTQAAKSARRYAEPILPRSRPLKWRMRPPQNS